MKNRKTNFPPETIPADERVELRERLQRDYAGMVQRALDLEVGLTQLPEEITDAEQAQRVTDFLGLQLTPFFSQVKAAHDKEKATFLALGRVCDEFFLARITKRLQALVRPVQSAMSIFIAREREERRRIQAEEKRRAEEALRKAEEEAAAHRAAAALTAHTNRGEARNHLEQAKWAEQIRQQAQLVIEAPPDKGHIRGDHGAVGYSREEWEFECEDPSAVPMQYLKLDEAKIRADITAAVKQARISGKPLPGIEIPGLRIYSVIRYIAKG